MSVAVLEEALSLVQRDLSRTWPEAPMLRLYAEEYDPTVEPDSWTGPGFRFALPNWESHGEYLFSDNFPELDAFAIVAVASAVRDTVVLLLNRVWPLCPMHDVGLHVVGPSYPGEGPSWRDWPEAAWLCRLDGGHVLGRVGELDLTKGHLR